MWRRNSGIYIVATKITVSHIICHDDYHVWGTGAIAAQKKEKTGQEENTAIHGTNFLVRNNTAGNITSVAVQKLRNGIHMGQHLPANDDGF